MRDPEVETSLDVIYRALRQWRKMDGDLSDESAADCAVYVRRELLLHHQYKINKALGGFA